MREGDMKKSNEKLTTVFLIMILGVGGLALGGCADPEIEGMSKDEVSGIGKADWPIDWCEINGWYDDGECDAWCPETDPDCIEGEEPVTMEGLAPGCFVNVDADAAGNNALLEMALTDEEGTDGVVDGRYERRLLRLCTAPGCDMDTGSFHAVPVNAAIGWAHIVFTSDGDEGITSAYVVDRVTYEDDGTISRVVMRELTDDDSGEDFGPSITMDRVECDDGGELPATFEGLPGYYVHAAPALADSSELLTLWLHGSTHPDEASVVLGGYMRRFVSPCMMPGCDTEFGEFESGLNFFTGLYTITFRATGVEPDPEDPFLTYILFGAERTDDGSFERITLVRGDPHGALDPADTFDMIRLY